MKHSDFIAWLVRLGHITEAKAKSQVNRIKAESMVSRDHPDVIAAVAEYRLSLAILNLIFKGA
ncbi:hypothetical protein [Sulfitobacter dubius]|uniref:hypothetical protein n=1 Tax=Sulfitobacter dubius TaxID=218673 RepID=UPI001FACB5A5|nr:hypothetical protein [Sulfitobacter dubius]